MDGSHFYELELMISYTMEKVVVSADGVCT